MRILVTGSDGFIGRHLVRKLIDKGHQVNQFDTNIGYSVLNATSVKNATAGCQMVYHLAGIVGVKRTMDLPVKTFSVNAMGTIMVALAAKEVGAKMFLASSSEVYGQGDRVIPLHEEMDIRCEIDKRWVYAASKLSAEMMVESILPPDQYVIGRFFNVVGPGQYPSSGMVLPRFIDQAVRNGWITVHGTGQQERTFGYVTEIVSAVVELMEKHHGTFNIAGTASCSIMELAERVKDVLTSNAEIVFKPGPKDAERRLADTRKLKDTLGWVPNMSLKQIIQLTAGWWLRCMESR